MAVAQTITFTTNINAGLGLGAGDHWDGYVEVIPPSISGDIFQGYFENWGGFDSQATVSPFINQPYAGYNTNWGTVDAQGLNDSFVNSPYAGYTTNWGTVNESTDVPPSLADVDNNAYIDHPKNQTIYYKVKGWNPNTLSYESWIISENITARPALDGGLFDPTPGDSPPNLERDIFKTPPSGNTLTNVIIVARWLE